MPEQRWKVETEPYLPDLRLLAKELSVPATLTSEMPPAPFPTEPPESARYSFLLCAACLNALASANELADGIIGSWERGRFLNSAVLTRSLFELWGFAHYGRAKLLRGNSGLPGGELERFWFGSSSNVSLPWGGNSNTPPIGVRQYIQHLDTDFENAGEDYAFLCDAAHPTMLQHFYLLMAGPLQDNWSNDTFRAHGHDLLRRLARIARRACTGMRDDITTVLTESVPNLRMIDR